MDKEEETAHQPNTVNTPYSFENHRFITTLPNEIVIEILLRLPVECLLRCKSVCKLWYFLISDPQFVKSHLSLSTSDNDYVHHRMMLIRPGNTLMSCPLYHVMDEEYDDSLELEYHHSVNFVRPWEGSVGYVRIVGSCNGLLCLRARGDALCILNPSTRRSNMLQYFGLKAWSYGFGYDESSDNYKVAAIFDVPQNETWVWMYSIKTAKWERTGDFPRGRPLSDFGVFSNGALHWIVSSPSWTIVSLNLASETYDEVVQPVYNDDKGYKCLTLGVSGGWLCLLCDYYRSHVDVWVMKVYGRQDSWTKLASLQSIDKFCWRSMVPYFPNDGKLLLQFGTKLVLYDVKNGSIIKNMNLGGYREVLPWTVVGSLVSPGEQ